MSTAISDQTAIEIAATWILTALTGPITIALGTLAVTFIGYSALVGRLSYRRAGAVVLGLFLIFGASSLSNALMSDRRIEPPIRGAPPNDIPNVVKSETGGSTLAPYDPYAGAAVPPPQN